MHQPCVKLMQLLRTCHTSLLFSQKGQILHNFSCFLFCHVSSLNLEVIFVISASASLRSHMVYCLVLSLSLPLVWICVVGIKWRWHRRLISGFKKALQFGLGVLHRSQFTEKALTHPHTHKNIHTYSPSLALSGLCIFNPLYRTEQMSPIHL